MIFNDFLSKPLSMLFQLTEHHFIGKNQRNFKKHKDKLNQEECILVLDFDGNCTFVIWNCATLSLEKFASGYSFLCFVLRGYRKGNCLS